MQARSFRAAAGFSYLVLGLLAFSGVLTVGFVSDDWVFLRQVDQAPGLVQVFHTINGRYFRPLVVLFYSAHYHLFGLRPFPFHLTSVCLHAFSALLVCLLAVRVDDAHRRFVGCAAGLIFVVLASHSEAVSCIAGVADPLLAPFMLGGLPLFARALEAPDPRGAMAAAWLLGAAGLLAKETAVVFPALAAAYGLFDASRAADRRARLRRTAVFAGVATAIVSGYLALRTALFGSALGAYGMVGSSRGMMLKEARAFVLRTFFPPMSIVNGLWHSDRDRERFSGEPGEAGYVDLGTGTWAFDTRPDVAAMFPFFPNLASSEWNYQVPCSIVAAAPGAAIRVHAVAVDGAGQRADLGMRTIHAPPFQTRNVER